MANARPVLFLDYETKSRANLPKCGAEAYARHESTSVLMSAIAVGDEPFRVWDATREPIPVFFAKALGDPRILKVAHNAAFEMAITRHVLGIETDPAQWVCTQVLALSLAFPAGLAQLSEVLGLADDKKKQADGRRLIMKFSVPPKAKKPTKSDPNPGAPVWPDHTTDPEDWARFVEYCRVDGEAEREVYRKLIGFNMPAAEWQAWSLDQKINARGLPVDLDLVRGALRIDADHRAALMARAVELTGLDNPNSRDQLIAWLNGADDDLDVDTLRKNDVAEILERDALDPVVAEVLRIRQDLSRSSVKKFHALAAATGDDGRLRGAFQFAGAGRTWRWAGRLVQPQNLPRGSIESPIDLAVARAVVKTGDRSLVEAFYPATSEVLVSVIRSAFAPRGRKLISVDFASIETVMVGWAAGCESLLEVFRAGRCAYKTLAVELFAVDYDAVTKKQRQYAKPPVLGCGYMLGVDGLIAYAEGYRVEMTEAESRHAVKTYRESYPEVVRFWYALQDAAFAAIRRGHGSRVVVGAFAFRFVSGSGAGAFLFLDLPSGRSLAYRNPQLVPVTITRKDGTTWETENLTYEGLDDVKKWRRISTHPGKITENIVQAISRDLLVDALLKADAHGFDVVGHVHDEILVEADEDQADATLETLLSIMQDPPAWAKTAPVKGAGWVGEFYRKD